MGLVVRLIALFGLSRVFGFLGPERFQWLSVFVLIAFVFGHAFVREAFRGGGARRGSYVGMDEDGPSLTALFWFAAFEAFNYGFIVLCGPAYVVLFATLPLLLVGMIWVEASLFYNRTCLDFMATGIQMSQASKDQLFKWEALQVTYGPTHVTLVAGDQRAKVRLGATQIKRFVDEYTGYGAEPVVHVVEPKRGIPWGKR